MKKINATYLILAASILGIIALVLFQVQWIRHSSNLLEEQFNNRVNMALCNAVEKIAGSEGSFNLNSACSMSSPEQSCQLILESIFKTKEGDAALNEALAFYKLDMPFEISVVDMAGDTPSNYSCSLLPLLESDTHYLNIDFTNKEAFILEKLGFMAFSSLAIIIFIGLIFLLSSYYLIRQKKMSQNNKDFFNHMTHEFRTPLTNIKLASRLLAKNTFAGQGDQYVKIIQQESGQLMEQLEQVLHLARLEQGDYQLKYEVLQLEELFKAVVEKMKLRIQAVSAKVSLHIPAALPLLKGDHFHLTNAFQNLIDNALKYSTEQPIIDITASKHDTGILIHFQDNGQGISPAQQKQVFGKFKQGNASALLNHKGFGLGLAYVKKIIDLHRGTINITSTLGAGTRFDLFFPYTQTINDAKTS
ncbi:MAG: HAMP domain-containing sensor histidine kinase [Saprospiraceae bacterium]